jgi:hypothetical protein
MLFIFLVFCVVCFVVIVFVFCLSAFCALFPMFPVSLDYPLPIDHSVSLTFNNIDVPHDIRVLQRKTLTNDTDTYFCVMQSTS